jgi:hypothetical protein
MPRLIEQVQARGQAFGSLQIDGPLLKEEVDASPVTRGSAPVCYRHLELGISVAVDVALDERIPVRGCCQTDANSSRIRQVRGISSGAERTPLGKSGSVGLLVDWAAGEAPFGVEELVDGGVDGDELLQTSDAPEALHRQFSPSERQVRVFRPVVPPTTRDLPVLGPKLFQGCPIEAQPICHQLLGSAMPLHPLLEELQAATLSHVLVT